MSERRQVLRGIAASPGVAVGRVCLFDRGSVYVPRRYIARDGTAAEESRLHASIEASRNELQALRDSLIGREQRLLIDAQLMMHRDELLIDGAIELLRERSINAEWALAQVIARFAEQMRGASEEYFRERAVDIEHVGERILRKLTGVAADFPVVPRDGVIVAEDLGPADAAQLLRSSALGIAIDLGSATSHTAILARALDIPAVVGLGGLARMVADHDVVLVDGFRGEVVLFPSEEEQAIARARGERFRAFNRSLRERADPSPYTRDGSPITLLANVELPAEAALAIQEGANGIGLYRTEFLFLDRKVPPDEEEQSKIYSDVTQVMAPRPVTFRTFDIGGDKLHGQHSSSELTNPALGLRAIRLGLQHPKQLRTQLRAMLRGSTHGDVRIMFPLVTSVDELRSARAILEEARTELLSAEGTVANVRVGVMIETPAAVLIADALSAECDFFSVGTNDLVQYTLAVDRGNPRVAHMASALHPAVLRLLDMTQAAAKKAQIGLAMCGGMAADPIALPLVLGLGYSELSVDLAFLPLVRAVSSSIDGAEARRTAQDALACPSVRDVKRLVIERFDSSLGELWREQGVDLES